ncbi:ATP-binding protein [Fodinibius sp.]|uniref:ATP-binding protein n=1 Tax=Fodinibius sp. TaxID=1872440 RepID=UPI002ACE6E54|nr:ATP-binding protein [Fodinibius sp.]MDZ7658880.1 ATP-binding protein [Fodinibius sp.]
MINFSSKKQLYHWLGWSLLALLVTGLLLEGWRYGVKPSATTNKEVVESSLDRATDYFLEEQKKLLSDSQNLANTLQAPLLQNRSDQYLYNTLNQIPDLWSAALYHENKPIIWRGFALQNTTQVQNRDPSAPALILKRHNNVIYWECHIPFSIQDSSGTTKYNLFTTYRIRQNNPLSIGGDSEFSLFNSDNFSTSYPLNFSIFSDPPAQVVQSETLTNLQDDSVGVVYATADEFEQTRTEWEENNTFWRSIFAVLSFVLIISILFIAAENLLWWKALLTQLLFVIVGWAISSHSSILSYWILSITSSDSTEWVNMVTNLSTAFTNAAFALIASWVITRKLQEYKHELKADWYLTVISLAGIFGVVNALGILSFFKMLFQATNGAGVALLDLRIFPEPGTIILYLVLGMATLAAGILLVVLNRMLFRFSREHLKLTSSVLSTSFILSLFAAQLFIPERLIFNSMFYSSILGFIIVLTIAISYEKELSQLTRKSRMRKVIIGSFLIAIVCLPAIYQAALNNTDDKLWQRASSYAQEEDQFAERLTRNLLIRLEESFRGITSEDLQENRSNLQTRFTQTIQDYISPRGNTYSLNLQLVNSSGELISDYATDLNSPNWVNMYNISTLQIVTEIEQITKSTIRPVVQLPQLVNQQKYRTFYRGWIPIFGISDQEPIAWILCSVYQERPEYNKPIRTVMSRLSFEDLNTPYLLQKFQNGKLINSVQQGFTNYFPKYRTLEQNQLNALQSDTLIYVTNETDTFSYRTLFWNESKDNVIKASTTLPGFRIILFSFFRFSFFLLLISGVVLLIKQTMPKFTFRFLGSNVRFQDRLIDSFLLATLIFLGFLIASSHYAIKQQNRDIVRQELVDKLERLSNTIESNQIIRQKSQLGSSFSLDSLTTPLDVDASFYTGRTVTETTTPQIYQQHLLPAALPYDIYHQLNNRNRQDAYSNVQLAGQNLLIGYRSILNNQNEPIATIAIPTFLESPKYDQQLLETISYLILVYLFVFGLFILGSTFISKQLTRPLVHIQRGLNKISGGNLDTTIPVTSDDEIGNLAEAYNNMVSRLKKLQKELAAAEREAAWKEMAQQVAHEIKNPLTPMKLNVQHLERQLKSDHQNPEELKKKVQQITANLIEQIQSLNHIASDFSKFSQPLTEDFKEVDLKTILNSVAKLYEHDEKVSIHLETPQHPVHIQGIKDELKRVIINLVKNAYEAMPDEGGKIVLRLYHHHKQNVFIEVEDNGSGIAEEDRPNIFVPNFSTKSSGTGLGLAICKKIIEAHEGSISFASVEGEGTTFVIKLPQN